MGSDGLGECSRKTDSENSGDDGAGDPERPLKKARYVWQVKGKYHLKDSFNNVNKDQNDPAEGSSTMNETSTEEDLDNNCANNNNNNVECRGRCCIEALLARSELMMASEESSDEEQTQKNMDKSISDEIPVTLVKDNQKNQDYYLMKWQAKQVAKGYLDNTINKVLESWMVALPFDANDFVENCDNDGQVEDEGILMAIQSHGLQSGNQNWGESSSNQDNGDISSVSFMRPQELAESTMDNYQNVHNELLKNKSSETELTNYNEDTSGFDNIEMGDHTNFLDAAVSVAIQKKGLTSQNYV